MKKRKTLFWRLLPSYWVVVIASLLLFTIYAYNSANSFYRAELEKSLEVRANLMAKPLHDLLEAQNVSAITALCQSQSKLADGTRFTVIDSRGKVLGDSEEDPSLMKNHNDREEIIGAMEEKFGHGKAVRYSQTLQQYMMYVAVPFFDSESKLVGVIRAALPMTTVNETLSKNLNGFILSAAIIGVGAMLLCIVMTSRIANPLENLKRTADRYANGDLHQKSPLADTEEIFQVAESMNIMAKKLDDRMNTIHNQRNELKAILSGLGEGVIAIDQNERIININVAASELLGIDIDQATGLSVQEAIRFANLQDFIAKITAEKIKDETELTIYSDAEKYLEIYGDTLKNAENEPIGVLIVLRDVTRIKHLEGMRKDFVANVSHELRTPITSIKGFVETMLESSEDFGDHARFLQIINKQANRLTAIIDDLLTLSRLEQNGTDKTILLTESPIYPVLKDAIEVCENRAADKKISIELDCDENLAASINQPLIEQAFVNLIDNAIKYSEQETVIKIAANKSDENSISIQIIDNGYGVDSEHLPRLFERFYRVDTARSRKLGGTGLGLAIVKHIVTCHGGNISVQSQPSLGSTFTVKLLTA